VEAVLGLGLERVLGGFEVVTQLNLGSEHLFLLFTESRLIMVHGPKVGRGRMLFSNILGRLSVGVEKGTAKSDQLQQLAGLSPESILQSNKNNFAITYDKIVSLTVNAESHQGAELTLLTNDMKTELSASLTAVQGTREVIESVLGPRAIFKR